MVFGVYFEVAAGQTVMHCHCHVIPWYVGDVKEPRGGVWGGAGERLNRTPSLPLMPVSLIVYSGFLFTIYSPFSLLIRHIYIICVIIDETIYNERLFSCHPYQGYSVRQDP